jgi:hypothetical protein
MQGSFVSSVVDAVQPSRGPTLRATRGRSLARALGGGLREENPTRRRTPSPRRGERGHSAAKRALGATESLRTAPTRATPAAAREGNGPGWWCVDARKRKRARGREREREREREGGSARCAQPRVSKAGPTVLIAPFLSSDDDAPREHSRPLARTSPTPIARETLRESPRPPSDKPPLRCGSRSPFHPATLPTVSLLLLLLLRAARTLK